jgi:hypothetical protein
MPPIRGALFVEGKGEQDAAPRLMKRLWNHLGLQPFVQWEVALQNNNFKDDAYLAGQLESIYGLRNGRYQLLVVMFDSDDKTDGVTMCPRDKGPATARVLRAANLPIPSAVVLPYQEYEHWFVACLPQWAGKPVVDPATQRQIAQFVANTAPGLSRINQRDGKGIIRDFLSPAEYEPTTHQSALTHMLDFNHLQQPAIDQVAPAFGTLCRACQFLAQQLPIRTPGAVYPQGPLT